MRIAYHNALWLLTAALLVGCVGEGARAPQNAEERFSLAYDQMALAYQDLIRATTPVTPGAQPLLSVLRGREVLARLDEAKRVLDAAYAAFLAGQPHEGGYQQWAAILRQTRAMIPVAHETETLR